MSVADSVVPSNRTQLFWGAGAGMFVFGIVLAILGTLFGLPEMRERLAIDLAQQGDIFLALYFGVFVSTVVVGPMIDSWGNKHVLVTSATLVAVALILFSAAHSFAAAMVAAFVLGFGGGGLNTSSNALVADLYVANRGAMLNLLGTFFGVGALFIPLLASVITGYFTITQLLLIGAVLSAICAVGFVVMRFPALQDRVGFSVFASVRAATIPGVLLFAFVLFFQSGNESSISGWISTYIGSLGAPARTATAILAGYWVALMSGRVASAKILTTMSKSTLILASGIGSAIGAALLLASNSVALLAVGAVVIGFSFAPIYPTVLAMAADRYQRLAGTIFGLLFAIGLGGGMAFPWGVGHISQSYGVRLGMVLPLVGSLAITILVLVIRSGETRSPSS